MSYSQNGEDLLIGQLFSDQPNGRLLDIGAYDGVTLSNSRALLERGWGGVLVEPEPHAFIKLFALYQGREDVQLVNAAVGTAFYMSRFWHTEDLVSTTIEAHHEKWRRAAKYDGQYWVAVVPIDRFFVDSEFDFVTVDVEGSSAELALRMLDYGWCPRVLCVEHDGEFERLIEVAANRDYRPVVYNAENLILARG